MITDIAIRDYQSLARVDIALKPFTVIVGPSSSGKSALIRALRTLTTNTRGTSFISTWASTASVSATTDRGTITLTRSRKPSQPNSYEILSHSATTETFTKLGGEVPPEVSRALGIGNTATAAALTFASQFDRPFLLGESPAAAASSLAALTNVEVVFTAAREANRTRLATASLQRTRTADIERLTAQLADFDSLTYRQEALQRAQDALTRAQQAQTSLTSIQALWAVVTHAEQDISRTADILARPVPVLDRYLSAQQDLSALTLTIAKLRSAKATIARTSTILSAPEPSLDTLTAAQQDLTALRDTIASLRSAKARAAAAAGTITAQEALIAQLSEEHTNLLTEAGRCPTCGQDTRAHTVITVLGGHS